MRFLIYPLAMTNVHTAGFLLGSKTAADAKDDFTNQMSEDMIIIATIITIMVLAIVIGIVVLINDNGRGGY